MHLHLGLLVWLLIEWIVFAACLLLVSALIRDFKVKDFKSALIAALIIVAINYCVGPILKLIALPLTVLTLGLFLFVVDAVILKLAALLSPGFKIKGFLPAIWAAIVLVCLHFLWRALVRA